MQVVQVVEIKHYRETIIMGDMHVLMAKVIEVLVPAYPWTVFTMSMMDRFQAEPSVDDITVRNCVRINPDDVVNYESLGPR
ncbi:hypothetical protein BGW39_010561 [Mortierella sp. 14UC]|nr:hypothetical protein BGW39_010561 [Mortierella sp. 14UC]